MSDSAAARLARKLHALDLADDEAALLGTVFHQAAQAGGPEVEAFADLTRDPLGSAFRVDRKFEFKGSDEELQAILDWLGSLEAQK